MKNELRGYAASISKYTGVTCRATIAEIEEYMRDEYRTLDHLSPQKFAKCARECWQAVAWRRTPEGAAYEAKLMRQMDAATTAATANNQPEQPI